MGEDAHRSIEKFSVHECERVNVGGCLKCWVRNPVGPIVDVGAHGVLRLVRLAPHVAQDDSSCWTGGDARCSNLLKLFQTNSRDPERQNARGDIP